LGNNNAAAGTDKLSPEFTSPPSWWLATCVWSPRHKSESPRATLTLDA